MTSNDSSREEPREIDAEPEQRKVLRTFVRNAPWLSMAILLHVLLITVFSVLYLATHRSEEKERVMALTVGRTLQHLEPPIEQPPDLIDRRSVPVLSGQEEGPVNPNEDYVPDAAPGLEGELTLETDPNADPGIYNPDPNALSSLPSGATGGTPIGVGNEGHHGNATSPYASRRVGGGGPGGGGPGQGGGDGPGGRTKQGQAVLSALVWLKEHQSPDGHWDADGFSEMCEKNACDGPGHSVHDVGVTGLALLCFLGAGFTNEMEGPFKKTVKDGLVYLMDVQDDDGCFGPRSGTQFLYNHACAALAMAEAYGMTKAKAFHDPAQRGIYFVQRAQNPYRAWRYGYPPDGDNDSSVTGWMVMVLKSGKLSELDVDDGAFTNAMSWIDEMTDEKTGRTGYTSTGGRPSRTQARMAEFPAERSESMTAVGMLCRIFSGRSPGEDPMIAKGADLLVRMLPTWKSGAGDIDFYYWYYGTLAMHQLGGPAWERWNEAIKTAIIDHQRVDPTEDEFGSWDPVDPWSAEGGRVYSTALNCLCMEVYYRYPRVFGASDREENR